MKSLKSLALASVCGVGLAAASSPALADALSTPSMSASLSANASPFSVDLPDWFGDAGGKIYVGGAVTGMAYAQSNAVRNGVGSADTFVDITNGQVFIQKTDGWLQFFVDAGAYSFPTVGYSYVDSVNASHAFGYVPVAYAKLAGSGDWSAFSVEAGKLPTLIGDEYGFTYQNLNIERGLVWNNEPIVSRGVQANYSAGPINVSVSWNDGTYSNVWSSFSALASYAFNGGADTVAIAGGGNTVSSSARNFFKFGTLGSGSQFNFIYTHTMGPWTISPYFQYNSTPGFDFGGGHINGSSAYAGALLVNYALDDHWKLGARGEYESESHGLDLFGYGSGSNAWSLTITPTYQYKIFYARVEGSYVGLGSQTAGLGFGSAGTSSSQFRGMIEAGVLF